MSASSESSNNSNMVSDSQYESIRFEIIEKSHLSPKAVGRKTFSEITKRKTGKSIPVMGQQIIFSPSHEDKNRMDTYDIYPDR